MRSNYRSAKMIEESIGRTVKCEIIGTEIRISEVFAIFEDKEV